MVWETKKMKGIELSRFIVKDLKVASQKKPPDGGGGSTDGIIEEDQASASWMKAKGKSQVKRSANVSQEELATTSKEATKWNSKKLKFKQTKWGSRNP